MWIFAPPPPHTLCLTTVYTAPAQAPGGSAAPPQRLREALRRLNKAQEGVTCAQSAARSQFATSNRRHAPGNRRASIPWRYRPSRPPQSRISPPIPSFARLAGAPGSTKPAQIVVASFSIIMFLREFRWVSKLPIRDSLPEALCDSPHITSMKSERSVVLATSTLQDGFSWESRQDTTKKHYGLNALNRRSSKRRCDFRRSKLQTDRYS